MFLRNPIMASCVAAAVLACGSAQAQTASPRQTLIPALNIGGPSTPPTAQGIAVSAGDDSALPASAQLVDQQIATYRQQVEARVARGDMSPDEAERLIGWHRWQLEQQAAGRAPASQIVERQNDENARRNVVVGPSGAPYYAPYYRPYAAPYYAPPYAVGPGYGPYYGPAYGTFLPGISVCAGSGGHHFGASVCF